MPTTGMGTSSGPAPRASVGQRSTTEGTQSLQTIVPPRRVIASPLGAPLSGLGRKAQVVNPPCKTNHPSRAQYVVTQGTRVEADHDLEQVYREQGDRLYYALLGYSGDPEIARDAVAEAFARALASSPSIREPVPWVWRVAFRIAGQEMKHRSRIGPPVDEARMPPVPPGLFEALAKLSDRQRASIVLHYYAGYSLDEIAAILGTRKGTVGTHLHRGRARLHELLEVQDD